MGRDRPPHPQVGGLQLHGYAELIRPPRAGSHTGTSVEQYETLIIESVTEAYSERVRAGLFGGHGLGRSPSGSNQARYFTIHFGLLRHGHEAHRSSGSIP